MSTQETLLGFIGQPQKAKTLASSSSLSANGSVIYGGNLVGEFRGGALIIQAANATPETTLENLTFAPLAPIIEPAVFNWINMNTETLASGSNNLYTLSTNPQAKDISVDNTPGDQHIIVEKTGLYEFTINGFLTDISGFSTRKITVGIGTNGALPSLGGFASCVIFDGVLPENLVGNIVIEITQPNTRIDVYLRLTSLDGTVTTSTIQLQQNINWTISKLGDVSV